MNPKLELYLKSENFHYLSLEDFKEVYAGEELINCGEWELSLDIPNGGILAVGIRHIKSLNSWERVTYREFGYFDAEGIVAYAKNVITKAETILKS